jgi:CBS domain-containing protein
MLNAELTRRATLARDLMTANPVSIYEHATLLDAAELFTDRDISAAPVIDDAGRPVGVLSRTDIVRFTSFSDEDAENTAPEFYDPDDPYRFSDSESSAHIEAWQLMTPLVYSIGPEESSLRVVEELLARNVNRLFVIDNEGVLIGVVSALDVLRSLVQ